MPMTDPYAPPKADVDAGAPAEIAASPQSMPGTVITAIVLVGVVVTFDLLSLLGRVAPLKLAEIPIEALIIVGLVRGHALAWQWGIIVPTLAVLGGLALLGPALSMFDGNPVAAALIFLLIAINVAIPIVLSTKSARIFYGLKCPKCGEVRGRAASFLFAKRKCAACKFVWTQVRR